jgi:Peptidase family C25
MNRITTHISTLLMLCVASLIVVTLSVSAVIAGPITVLEDNARELVIELTLSDWETSESEDGVLYLPAGSGVDSRLGMRLTPYFSRLIALPASQKPQIVIEEQRWGEWLPGLAPEGNAPEDNLPVPQLDNGSTVLVSEPHVWRNRNVAHLFVVPVREQNGGILPLEYIRVRIVYPRATGSLRSMPDRLVRNGLLNGTTAQAWGIPRTPERKRGIASLDLLDGQIVRIEIEQEGVYQISAGALEARGIDVSGFDPRKFRLYNNGGQRLPTSPAEERPDSLIENAIRIEGQADGSFDSGDRILFYGRSVNTWLPGLTVGSYNHTNNPFTRQNVYWLQITNSGADGKRMADLEPDIAVTYEADVARSRTFIDNDVTIFYSNSHPESGLKWYAKELVAGESYSTTFDLDRPLAEADANLRVSMRILNGFTNTAALIVNNTVVDTIILNSDTQSRSIPANVLQNGSNTFTFRLLGGRVFFDYLEVDYLRTIESSDGRIFFDALPQDGVARIEFTGMTNPWVFDIQDYADVRVARGETVNISSQVSSPRRHLAVENDKLLAPVTIRAEGFGAAEYPNGLRDPGLSPSTIYIHHSDFEEGIRQFEAYVEDRDQREILCVDIEDIYKEFSWGLYDPVAIRDFLMYAYFNYSIPPESVMLVGDGDYDYRNITSDADKNWIPPYEDGVICRDYWYVQFTANDITQIQMVMGRLPVQSNAELEVYLDKLQRYENDSDLGAWRSRLVMVADDEYLDTGPTIQDQIHMEQAEEFATEAAPDFITVKKIYVGTYPTTFDPLTGGRRKPAANAALLNEINRGALMVSFIGHGNAHVWTHESVLLDTRDNQLINSGDRTPFYLAATCSWGHFDRPQNEAHPEQLLIQPGGAIGVVGATRLTNAYSNNRFALAFYERVFDRAADMTAGEALQMAMIDHPEGTNQYYHYFGDPNMKLALPLLDADMTSVDPDSLSALGTARITGEVRDPDGTKLLDFDGEALITVYDSADTLTYSFTDSNGEPHDELDFLVAGGTLFRGLVTAEAGSLHADFIVPRDVKYGSQNGIVHMYAFNDETDGVGSTDGIKISTQSASSTDHTPPDINLYFDYPNWRDGDLTSASPTLFVELDDSSGINLTGDIGHDIRAVIDGSEEILLTETFTYERDSYTEGIAEERLFDLEPGEHRLEVWAWDNANNFARIETQFIVLDADQELALTNVLNWPNPFERRTSFTFELSTDAEVTIKIFTASGRQIRKIGPIQCSAGFNYPASGSSQELEWDGLDAYGDPVANGAYLYVIKAASSSGQSAEEVGKLLRIR